MYMKHLIKIFVVCAFAVTSVTTFGQSVQSGFVKEYNEKLAKTPLEKVEIVISNASTTLSGEQGEFALSFRTLKAGDKVNVRRIEKLGYEIFNKEALEQWYISRDNRPFFIVMCKSERFKRIRDTYSRVSSESYDKQLKKEEAYLEAERKAGRLKDVEYEEALKKLNEEYDKQLENLDNYIDKFSRIDLSELSDVETEIIELVQRGKIEKAIWMYEQQHLEERYKEQVAIGRKTQAAIDTLTSVKALSMTSRDSLFASILRKNKMLMLAGGKENFEKIGKSLKEIALSDTTYLDAVWEYAIYAQQQSIFYDALDYFALFIRNVQCDSKLIIAYIRLADTYRKLKRFEKCNDYLNLAQSLIRNYVAKNPDAYEDLYAQVLTSHALMLYETNKMDIAERYLIEAESIYAKMVADSTEVHLYKLSKAQNNLGNLYRKIRDFDKAEHYMLLSLHNTERLYNIDSTKYLFDLASTHNNLGLIYRTLQDDSQAEIYYRHALEEMEQLMNQNPNAYREEYLKYLNNLGVLLKNMKRYEDAEYFYVRVLEQADILYSLNQEAYAMYLGNAFLNIGNLYIKMNRLDHAICNLQRGQSIIRTLYTRNPGAFCVSFLSINLSLGNAYVYVRQYEAAESVLLETLSLIELLRKNHTKTFVVEYFATLKNVGITYDYLGNVEKAETYYLKALETIEILYKKHPKVYESEIISIKYILGVFYQSNEKPEKAKKMLCESLNLCKQNESIHQQKIEKITNVLSLLVED